MRIALPPPLLLLFILLLSLLHGSAPRPAHGGEKAAAPPLELTVRLAKPRAGYGDSIRLTVRLHNPRKKAVIIFQDGRLDGALRLDLVDDWGGVWNAGHSARVQANPYHIQITVPGLGPAPTTRIAPGKHLDLTFALAGFTHATTPAGAAGTHWIENLPPGRYRVRVSYEKTDDRVPVPQVRWHVRLLQSTPAITLRSVPGLWTGRLQAETTLTVTAPQQAAVDALQRKIRTLEAANQALRTQLDAIREILRGG